MSVSHVQVLDIASIKVRGRIRRDLGDLESLKESMARSGLLNPVIVTTDYILVAGQRRLEAAKQLGWHRIHCYIVDTEDPAELLQVELDENVARKDFSSDELADALLRLDSLQNPPWPTRLGRAIRRFIRRIGEFFRRLLRGQSDHTVG